MRSGGLESFRVGAQLVAYSCSCVGFGLTLGSAVSSVARLREVLPRSFDGPVVPSA